MYPVPNIKQLQNKKYEEMRPLVNVSTERDIIAIALIICCGDIMDGQRRKSQEEVLLVYSLQSSHSPGFSGSQVHCHTHILLDVRKAMDFKSSFLTVVQALAAIVVFVTRTVLGKVLI